MKTIEQQIKEHYIDKERRLDFGDKKYKKEVVILSAYQVIDLLRYYKSHKVNN